MSAAELTTNDLLAMYRCAFYSAMGVTDEKPTDRQCLAWLQRVIQQAAHRTDPPIVLIPQPPEMVYSNKIVSPIQILRWDAAVAFPEWKDLPR